MLSIIKLKLSCQTVHIISPSLFQSGYCFKYSRLNHITNECNLTSAVSYQIRDYLFHLSMMNGSRQASINLPPSIISGSHPHLKIKIPPLSISQTSMVSKRKVPQGLLTNYLILMRIKRVNLLTLLKYKKKKFSEST